jgi:hypothetical protein
VGNLSDGGFKAIEESSKIKLIRKELLRGRYEEYCHDCNRINDLMNIRDRTSFIRDDLIRRRHQTS